MDFAKKQMEKFGWKEGSGLGKNNQGMVTAIKPTLKTGKEGMGYDFSKELVDTWWTRAYDDSLKRINIETDGESSETVGVTLKDDDEDDDKAIKEDEGKKKGIVASVSGMVERPFEKMKKRMMKARFTTFAKGATLSNGEMVKEAKLDSSSDDSDDEDDNKKEDLSSKGPKSWIQTDEELFKACGGRTAHKAARFGLKLNGKLARIAAQEEANKRLISKPQKSQMSDKQHDDKPLQEDLIIIASKDKKDKKKKKKSKREAEENPEEVERSLEPVEVLEQVENLEEDSDSKKKRKKNRKRKYAELENDLSENPAPASCQDIDNISTVNANILEDDPEISRKSLKKKKKSKKVKLAGNNDEETCALLSE